MALVRIWWRLPVEQVVFEAKFGWTSSPNTHVDARHWDSLAQRTLE